MSCQCIAQLFLQLAPKVICRQLLALCPDLVTKFQDALAAYFVCQACFCFHGGLHLQSHAARSGFFHVLELVKQGYHFRAGLILLV